MAGRVAGGRARREGARDGVVEVEVESGVRSGSALCRGATGCCVNARRGMVMVVMVGDVAVEVE